MPKLTWQARPRTRSLALFIAAYLAGAGFAEWLAINPGTGISIWPPSGLFIATLAVAQLQGLAWWLLAGGIAESAANLLWFHNSVALPAPFANGMFIGEHGSWNRKPPAGYKVVFVPFADGKPSGQPVDVLTGFVSADGDAYGRPVGVAIDAKGALLVADDLGNAIWRATGTSH